MNAVWAKSSLSFSNGNCVEVTELPGGTVGVRNSRDPGGPVLSFSRDEWDAFLGGARNGEFDGFGTQVSRPDNLAPERASGTGRASSTPSPAWPGWPRSA